MKYCPCCESDSIMEFLENLHYCFNCKEYVDKLLTLDELLIEEFYEEELFFTWFPLGVEK